MREKAPSYFDLYGRVAATYVDAWVGINRAWLASLAAPFLLACAGRRSAPPAKRALREASVTVVPMSVGPQVKAQAALTSAEPRAALTGWVAADAYGAAAAITADDRALAVPVQPLVVHEPAPSPEAAAAPAEILRVVETAAAPLEGSGVVESAPELAANAAGWSPALEADSAVMTAVALDPAILGAVAEVSRPLDELAEPMPADAYPAVDAPTVPQDPARPSAPKRSRKNGSRRKS